MDAPKNRDDGFASVEDLAANGEGVDNSLVWNRDFFSMMGAASDRAVLGFVRELYEGVIVKRDLGMIASVSFGLTISLNS